MAGIAFQDTANCDAVSREIYGVTRLKRKPVCGDVDIPDHERIRCHGIFVVPDLDEIVAVHTIFRDYERA